MIRIMEQILTLLLGLAVGIIVGYMLTRRQHEKQVAALTKEQEERLAALKSEHDRQMTALKSEHDRQMTEQKQEQQGLMEQQLRLIKAEMNAASERILKERVKELSTNNEQQLSGILNPLRENIRLMKEAVEKSDRAQTVTMERLDASIKENLRQAQEVGERADKLAQAIKRKVFHEMGEMMFTHFGVTGPLVLSASAHLRDYSRGNYRLEIAECYSAV